MVICFDIDGTISAEPKKYLALMNSLCGRDDITVYVLTGTLDFNQSYDTLKQIRIDQLRNMGIIFGLHYDDVFVMVGHDVREVADMKGQFCLDNKADVLIDDSPLYLSSVARISPLTMRLLPHIM